MLVKGRQYEPKFEATELTQKLMQTAGTFGDPLQAVFSLPGIVQVDEEDAEPAVQGSSPDANLFLVDNLPVGFLFHSFGESIFNENLIHDFGLNTAGFGASYGKATGAVFDVSLRDPKNQPMENTVDISFLRLGYLAEGAVTKNQSFYFSYRESLIPLYIEKGEDEEEDITIDDVPRATDYQGKYFWQLDDSSSLTLQLTGARDKAAATFGERSEEVLLDPGFEGGASLEEEFNSQGLTWINNDTRVVLGHLYSTEEFRIGSGEFYEVAEDSWILKAAHSWSLFSHTLTVGAEIQNKELDYSFDSRLDRCSDLSSDACEFDLGERAQDQREQSIVTYDALIEDQWRIGERVTLTAGLHASADDYLDEVHIDPRANIDWRFADKWTLQTSIGKYHQLPEAEEMLPVIGNPNLQSIESTHYVVGLSHATSDSWSWDAELYYKDIENLVVGIEDGPTLLNQVASLEIGADDYVIKPIHPRVLLARIKVLLRREEFKPVDLGNKDCITHGGLVLYQGKRQAHLHGKPVNLTEAEFGLLWLLAENPEQPLSRDDIMQSLRGIEYDGIDRSIDNRVVSLRRKLGDSEGLPKKIITVRGKGYLFVSDQW